MGRFPLVTPLSLAFKLGAAAQLQMGQPSLRYVERNVTASICFTSSATYCSPEALTLVADPAAIFGVDFDNLFLVRSFRMRHVIPLMVYCRLGKGE